MNYALNVLQINCCVVDKQRCGCGGGGWCDGIFAQTARGWFDWNFGDAAAAAAPVCTNKRCNIMNILYDEG